MKFLAAVGGSNRSYEGGKHDEETTAEHFHRARAVHGICARASLGRGGNRLGGGLVDSPEEGGSVELNNGYNKGGDPGSGLIGAREGSATNGVAEVSTAEALARAVEQGGAVKLTANIDISATLAISGSVELDLNGYVLRYENTQAYGSVLKVESGGSLTIKDSSPSAVRKFKPNDDGLWVLDEANGTEEVKGGIITGGTGTLVDIYQYQTFGGGVYVSGGKLTMEGGNIVGCRAVRNGRPAFGGGVYLCSDNVAGMASSFVMNGGGIVGCASVDRGGGVCVEPMCEFVMNSGSEIRACVTRNGGGVYINSSGNATGKLTLNGGKILSCKAVISTPVAGRGGGVYNEGQFTMNSGGIEKCTSADGESDGVWNSGEFSKNGGTIDGNVAGGGTVSLTVGVSGEEEFLDALENKNVTTIKLLKNDISVSKGDALTIDRPITIVNGSGYAGCDLLLHRPFKWIHHFPDQISFFHIVVVLDQRQEHTV